MVASYHLIQNTNIIDLIYLENKHLNKASYGLVCIDIFSKKGDVELMKKKTAKETVSYGRNFQTYGKSRIRVL